MNDLKIGPCAVIFQDEFLGVCDDGLRFGGSSSTQAVTAQQTSGQAQDRILTALNITVTAGVARAGRAVALLFGETGALGVSGVGRRFGSRGGELRLIPLNPLDATGYRMRRAVPNLSFQYHFRATAPHQAQVTFDILPDADGLLVQCIEARTADRALIPSNPPPDVIALEQALAAWLAGLLGLAGNEVCRGELPDEKYGCVVAVEGKLQNELFEVHEYRVYIEIIHRKREIVLDSMAALVGKLPQYELDFAKIIRETGQVYPTQSEKNNNRYFHGRINLAVTV